MDYLISGLKETDFINRETDHNQLRYEKYLRTIVADKNLALPEGEIRLHENSRLGLPWKYEYHHGSGFLDKSTFYSTLQKVELDAATVIAAKQDISVDAVFWSYGALEVWCGKEKVCSVDTPVYKPITRHKTVLNLKKGDNRIYCVFQNLGVRDTRNLFGIQILNHREKLSVKLPDEEHTEGIRKVRSWLDSIQIKDSVLTFQGAAPKGAQLAYDGLSPDFALAKTRRKWMEIGGLSSVSLDNGKPGVILVSAAYENDTFTRTVENILAQRPVYSPCKTYEENKKAILERVALAESLSRGDKFGFSISNILARKALGIQKEKDRALLIETLKQIEDRYDCSDFLVCGLIRYMKNYEMDPELLERAKDVLLNWRYWMDQDGSDAMCFWSENHSLMFYACAMQVGKLYPDAYFVRAKMTGAELSDLGREKVRWWLRDVKEHGFEEFLSTVYMCVTFAALLNVIDYSDPDISEAAIEVTDELLRMLCRHTFDGSILAPMGRVYREAVYPFRQGAQALINLINPSVPYSFGEGWLAFYATSKYRLPDDLCRLMSDTASISYSTGNARICLEKTADFCVTSAQSPRTDGDFTRWENLTLLEGTDTSSCAYTKSLNERYHGTTCFEPGVYGYQQHMWYAALDKETAVFTNHPGEMSDGGSMRPGFWYGNGVIPALKQKGNVLGAVYCIPENHPIHFTHVYFPVPKFDEVKLEQHWLFGKKKDGYVAIWCSGDLEPESDRLFSCEYRVYGDETAYFCICESSRTFAGFEQFQEYAKHRNPVYDSRNRRLDAGQLSVAFTESRDSTQYI